MGIIRVLLALVVVSTHSGTNTFKLNLINGRGAVCLFFIISGFYMTLILNRKYVGPGSVSRFYLARALRLWPTYLVALIFGLLVKYWTGTLQAYWRPFIPMNPLARWGIVFSNIFIIGQDACYFVSTSPQNPLFWAPKGIFPDFNGHRLLVNMAAYTVSIEATFYLIAPFVVRSLRRTVGFFCVGAIYQLVLFYWFKHITVAGTYYFFMASYIYFGAGALAFHLSQPDFRIRGLSQYAVGLALVVMTLLSNLFFPGITIICFALSVPLLFRITQHFKLDRMLGELSYSLYLFHLPVLDLLLSYIGRKNLDWIGALCTFAVAILVYLLVERPINRWRARLAEAEPKPTEAVPEREACASVA